MPTTQDLKSSKFLTKHDVEPPVLVTIQSYEELNVAMESQAPEMKWTLSFKELDKPLVLNMTNGQLIEMITSSEDFDDWIGKQIVLYNDKTVSFAGKITGGIRVREPNVVKAAARAAEELGNHYDGSQPTNPDYVGDDPPPPTDDIAF